MAGVEKGMHLLILFESVKIKPKLIELLVMSVCVCVCVCEREREREISFAF